MSDIDLGKLVILMSRFSTEDIGKLMVLSGVKLKNPVIEFKNREKRGDFDPLQDGENEDNMPRWREPLTDEEYEYRKRTVLEKGMYWRDAAEISGLDLLANMTRDFDEGGIRLLLSAYVRDCWNQSARDLGLDVT